MKQANPLARIAPLFLVLFIDGMGLSLLFPIMNNLIMQPTSHFLPHAASLASRSFIYGLVIGIYMIFWFFGAAIMGDLSDSAGRKRALMVCLIGACIGYFISGIGVGASSIAMLLVGRLIAGLTAGSQPIAQAAIVDVSNPAHKARNIGFILFSVSMGFVLGPLIGGVLSDSNVVSWFSYSTPLYFAAILSLFNAFLLQILFKETFIKNGKFKINFIETIALFISAFKCREIRLLSFSMALMIFGWANYYTFVPMYLDVKYHFTAMQISLFMATLGIGFGIGCSFLVDFCSRHFSYKQSVIWGSFIAAIGVLLVLILPDRLSAWIVTIFIGMAICIAYSIMVTMFSDQVSADKQGWIMGVTGSIMALCFGLTSFLTGIIVRDGVNLPMIFSIVGLILTGLLMSFFKPANH